MKRSAKPVIEGRPPVVIVTWEDACLQTGPSPLSEVDANGKLSTRHTVGFLVLKTAAKVVLAVTFDPAEAKDSEHHVDDLYTIPAKWIKNIETITKGES